MDCSSGLCLRPYVSCRGSCLRQDDRGTYDFLGFMGTYSFLGFMGTYSFLGFITLWQRIPPLRLLLIASNGKKVIL